MVEQIEKRHIFSTLWKACPIRNALAIIGSLTILLYFTLRRSKALMEVVAKAIVRPYHRIAGKICSVFPFSVAELIYALAILLGIGYIVKTVINLVKKDDRPLQLYKFAMTILSACVCFYGGFCLLWGVYYHSSDFAAQSGMSAAPVSVEALEHVTVLFAEKVNEYGALVSRDENGIYSPEASDILERSVSVFRSIEEEYSFLQGDELRPKPMVFSPFMSYINFTGFFFPFTGEANLNVDAPLCFLPSTAAHEIAHQRGIAAEDEANFIAVLACLGSGDIDFQYSGALLAYIHLGNALYSVDKEAYWAVVSTLSEPVMADIRDNSAYWDRYETKAAEISESVYTSFLQSYGDSRGMKSYGACVDLLVVYYFDEGNS